MVIAYDRHHYDPTWAGLNWGRSLGTAKDRLGLTLAAEDAAVAAVMRDVLDEELVESLAEGFEHAAGMSGATTTPSLSLDRPGPQGWLLRTVFVVMAIVAIGVGFVIGVAQLAIGLVVGIVGARRRGTGPRIPRLTGEMAAPPCLRLEAPERCGPPSGAGHVTCSTRS